MRREYRQARATGWGLKSGTGYGWQTVSTAVEHRGRGMRLPLRPEVVLVTERGNGPPIQHTRWSYFSRNWLCSTLSTLQRGTVAEQCVGVARRSEPSALWSTGEEPLPLRYVLSATFLTALGPSGSHRFEAAPSGPCYSTMQCKTTKTAAAACT